MSIDNLISAETSSIVPPNVTLPSETRFDKQLNPEDMKLLQEQWNIFNQLLRNVIFENPIQKRKQEGGLDLVQGTLVHGTTFDLEKLQKIKDLGIVSGELIGIPEDSETHYCADFFRVPENMSVSQYLEWCSQPIINGPLKTKKGEFKYLPMPSKNARKIGFIIDTSDPKLQPLLRFDAYGSQSYERMQSIINVLPRDIDVSPSRTTSAILVGIPGNFINGVIIDDSITNEELSTIKQIMGEKTLIYRTNGEVI